LLESEYKSYVTNIERVQKIKQITKNKSHSITDSQTENNPHSQNQDLPFRVHIVPINLYHKENIMTIVQSLQHTHIYQPKEQLHTKPTTPAKFESIF